MGTFAGISQQQSFGRRPYTFSIGFRSILQEYPDTLRFIKVTDFKGVPLQNVSVTVHNTGGDSTTVTDQGGVAEITPDVGINVTVDLRQYSIVRNGITYNTTTSPFTRTLILDSIIPHL
jgi:hypothetical protein